jgi:hypothetical protein
MTSERKIDFILTYILLKARSLFNHILTYDIGRKLAEKVRKEQAMTVNSLRLELATLQKLVFEQSCELRCATCLNLFEPGSFLQHVMTADCAPTMDA